MAWREFKQSLAFLNAAVIESYNVVADGIDSLRQRFTKTKMQAKCCFWQSSCLDVITPGVILFTCF